MKMPSPLAPGSVAKGCAGCLQWLIAPQLLLWRWWFYTGSVRINPGSVFIPPWAVPELHRCPTASPQREQGRAGAPGTEGEPSPARPAQPQIRGGHPNIAQSRSFPITRSLLGNLNIEESSPGEVPVLDPRGALSLHPKTFPKTPERSQ